MAEAEVIYMVLEDGSDYYNMIAAFTDLEQAKAWVLWYDGNIKRKGSFKGETHISSRKLDPPEDVPLWKTSNPAELVRTIAYRDGGWVETHMLG